MIRYFLIGPTFPYRGGIAHYTTLLAKHLRQEHEVKLVSFSRQYPNWIFPGQSNQDPTENPLQTEAEYLIDPLNPLSWRRVLRRMREWQPDIVVIPWWVPYWTPAWSVIGRGVRRIPSKPKLIFICHNVMPHESGLLDKVLLRIALSSGDGYIVHAESDEKRLLEIFPDARVRVTPIPTFADLVDGVPAPIPATIPDNRPMLLFFGFIRPYKGLDVLLEAMPQVLEKRLVHLLIAGEFWRGKEDYLDQINQLDLSADVTIVDRYLTNQELAACILRSDVVVLPYRNATQSAVVQVAFGLGKPVITTAVGGLTDVVSDGQTGIIVQPNDPNGLAEAISRYFEDNLMPEFQAAIQAQFDLFSWDHLTNAIEDLANLENDHITANNVRNFSK
jgi:glycosyltransferase involved in cell wall biosynthesis